AAFVAPAQVTRDRWSRPRGCCGRPAIARAASGRGGGVARLPAGRPRTGAVDRPAASGRTEPRRLPAPRSFREEAGGSISPASLRARAFAKQIAALRRLRAPISFTVPCTALLRAHRHFVPSSPKERGEGTHPTARQYRRPPAETTTPDHPKD